VERVPKASDDGESIMSSPGIEANADLMLMEDEAGDALPYRPLNILRPPFLDSVPPLHTWPDDLCRDVVPAGAAALALSLSVLSLSLSVSLALSPTLSCALSLSLAPSPSLSSTAK
jgi:hypothetical protein